MGALTASAGTVTLEQALQVVKRQFQDSKVDYFLVDNNNATAWNIFVDMEPTKGWSHRCCVASVPKNIASSVNLDKYVPQKVSYTMPPKVKYIPLEATSLSSTNTDYTITVTKPTIVSSKQREIGGRTYALIISGGISSMTNYERYWNDCAYIYRTLRSMYMVHKENIYPLMSDGNDPEADMRTTAGQFVSQPLDLDEDGENEIELAATKSNIASTLTKVLSKINEDDHLFIFVIDHGGTTDYKTNSYICLWNHEKLYDYELANMLKPFEPKYPNINVVLGQCFSGGFVDDLQSINGCVVATACSGSESSWACKDIPHDEFVYQWTKALNYYQVGSFFNPFSPDHDGNKRTTMLETFKYARGKDREEETPQYYSNPASVGEDLAFNYLAPAVDLYIKDNPEDTGLEPNMTTNEFWNSPSIWVRNQDDGIEEHENPIRTSTHLGAMAYAKIENRGKKDYSGGMYFHLYLANASTVVSQKTWKGRETYNGKTTGGHWGMKEIGPISAGEIRTVGTAWSIPEQDDIDNENQHYCLMVKLIPTSYDEKYEEGITYFDRKGSNDVAQKNVSIISRGDLSKFTSVFVRNDNDTKSTYTLEIVPATPLDSALFSMATVDLRLSPKIYNAWTNGGKKYESMTFTESAVMGQSTAHFISTNSRLKGIVLDKNEFDKVSLKVNFKPMTINTRAITFDLVQKDENGKILGGETFIVESGFVSVNPLNIETSSEGDKSVLRANASNFETLSWYDEDGNELGKSETLVINQSSQPQTINAVATDSEGGTAFASISLDAALGIKNLSPDGGVENNLTVTLKQAVKGGCMLVISSVKDGLFKMTRTLNPNDLVVDFNTSNLTTGVYAVSLMQNGILLDSRKFTKL